MPLQDEEVLDRVGVVTAATQQVDGDRSHVDRPTRVSVGWMRPPPQQDADPCDQLTEPVRPPADMTTHRGPESLRLRVTAAAALGTALVVLLLGVVRLVLMLPCAAP